MESVLYISYDGLTDPLGQSQILPYIEGLAGKGYHFTVISFEKPTRYQKNRRQIERRCAEHSIDWQPLSYTKRPPVLSTLYDIDKLQKKAFQLYQKTGFDLVHCRSYIPALVGLRIKNRFKLPFIFDMRGFWADERVDGHIWNLNNPVYKTIYRYFKVRERAFLEKADAVVSLTHTGKAELENWYNEDPLYGADPNYYNYDKALAVQKKTTVIPCATDLGHFDYGRITGNKRKWLAAVHGIDMRLEYLGYVGSLGTWYMADEMLDLYAQLLKSRPQLRFLILSQDDISVIRRRAEEKGIPRSYLIQVAAERKEVPVLMSLMAASVFFILPAYSKKASSPTKQGELMATGVPVICNDHVGDTGKLVREYRAGQVVEGFSSTEYDKIATNWDAITSLDRGRIRKGAEEYFSLERGIEKYRGIYEKVLSLS